MQDGIEIIPNSTMDERTSGVSAREGLGWTWTVITLTLLGGGLRFAALGAKTLWLDEAFSLWMANHSLPDLFAWLVYIDHHPPLYYTLLHFWIRGFGESAVALRSLSALSSTLAIPFFALAARKLAGSHVSLVATFLLAIAPFHIRYAQETRMYGVLTLAGALLLLAVAQVLRERAVGRGWWALLAIAEAAAMLTHNTATVLVPLALNGAVGLLWLVQRGRSEIDDLAGLAQPRFAQRWSISQFVALLFWSPWAAAFVRQAQVVDSNFWIAPPDLWTVWMALTNLTFGELPVWFPLRAYWAWLALSLILVGVWQCRRSNGVTALLVALWLLPPVVELAASLRRPIFYDRTLIWTTLPYLMLVARGMVWPGAFHWATDRLAPRLSWLFVTLALFGALGVLGAWNYYANFAKEDWDKVAQLVAARAQPDDLILFHASWSELPFAYYYPDDAPELTQHGVPADLFDAGELEPPMRADDVPRVEQLLAGEERVWLVYSHWWYTDVEGLLPRVLASELALVEEWAWPGIRLLYYERVE